MIRDRFNQNFEEYQRQRIISLVPSITETLFDLGLGNQIIGVTRYCIYPIEAQQKHKIGGTKSPKLEFIKNLKPDLIFVNEEENTIDDFEQLRQIAPTFVTYPKTVEEGFKLVYNLAKLLDVERNHIEFVRSNYDQLLTEVKKKEFPMKSVFCPIWKDPWMTINSDTYINSMLNLFNLENIFFGKTERYPRIELSEIREDIDLILLPDEPFKFGETEEEYLKTLKHFKNSKFYLINGSYVSWYGTRILKALPYFLNLLSS